MSKKILIGVAWPYVNGDIHVGHLGGYLLPADIIARCHRLLGNDVLMVSGSDCYGTPITVEADKKGLSPKEVVDIYHKKDLELFKQYKLSYNLYTKTTSEEHKKVVHQVFLKLLENGYIEKGTMQQYYAIDDKQFLPDRYVEGTCPHCNAENQRSDQCENCGRWLKDGELLNPVSKLSGSKVTLKDTEHYFLNFQKLQDELRTYLDGHKDDWKKWVWKEADGWLREGLQKRAITRDMDWSMELPIEDIKKLSEDKQLENFEGKRIYVWFEAVIGYLSAAVEWSKMTEGNEDTIFYRQDGQSTDWEDWWKNEDSVIYNFMGQDNLVFHTLMWPGELMGMKSGHSLPKYVVVNKFLNYEGKKFSKSRNWTIDSKKIAEKYGVDLVRYYVARTLPENKEGNFTWEDFVFVINNELVANLGNLVNRALTFIQSKFDGNIEVDTLEHSGAISTDGNFERVKMFLSYDDKVVEDIHSEGKNGPWIVKALDEVMDVARKGNVYFDEQKVWEVIKTDKEKAKQILMNLINLIYDLGVLIYPFLPDTSDKIMTMLGQERVTPQVGRFLWLPITNQTMDGESKTITKVELGKVELLFQKLEIEKVLEEKED